VTSNALISLRATFFLNSLGVLLSFLAWLTVIRKVYFSIPTFEIRTTIIGSVVLFVLFIFPSVAVFRYIWLKQNIHCKTLSSAMLIKHTLQIAFFLPYLFILYIVSIQGAAFEMLLLPPLLLYQSVIFTIIRCEIKEV